VRQTFQRLIPDVLKMIGFSEFKNILRRLYEIRDLVSLKLWHLNSNQENREANSLFFPLGEANSLLNLVTPSAGLASRSSLLLFVFPT